MQTIQKDERDLLDVLKFELEFLEKGGYQPSPREPRGFRLIFEDSPTCMNYDSKENPAPCSECALMSLVPPEERNRAIPCRHIPLNSQGETLDSLYRCAGQRELEEVYGKWLRSTIETLTEGRRNTLMNAGRRGGANRAAAGSPLFGKLHPKCANASCPVAFHWLEGGTFFRFRPQTAQPAGAEPGVRHYWLCERCSETYTLTYDDARGVMLEPKWPELRGNG
jgi:hypothetical protein